MSTSYDHARRRQAVRRGRETGRWVYIPGELLDAMGMTDRGQVFYRTWAGPRRTNPSAIVQFYRER